MIALYETFVVEFFDFNNLIIKFIMIFSYEVSNTSIIYVFLYMLYVECLFF